MPAIAVERHERARAAPRRCPPPARAGGARSPRARARRRRRPRAGGRSGEHRRPVAPGEPDGDEDPDAERGERRAAADRRRRSAAGRARRPPPAASHGAGTSGAPCAIQPASIGGRRGDPQSAGERNGPGSARRVRVGRSARDNVTRIVGPGPRAPIQFRSMAQDGPVGRLGPVDELDLRPVFQPIVDLRDGAVVGYEALMRGGPTTGAARRQGAARGRPARGQRGRARPRRARRRAADRRRARARRAVLALPQRGPGDARRRLARAARRRGFTLLVEVTEQALIARPEAMLRALTRLRSAGWGIALDDVGADSRSLALMSILYPDVIKLDLRLLDGRARPRTSRGSSPRSARRPSAATRSCSPRGSTPRSSSPPRGRSARRSARATCSARPRAARPAAAAPAAPLRLPGRRRRPVRRRRRGSA